MGVRIVHVTATFPPYRGGTGQVVFQTALTQAARGHRVAVATPAAEPGAAGGPLPFAIRRLRPAVRWGNASWSVGWTPWLLNFDIIHIHYPFVGGAEPALQAGRRRGIPVVLTYHNRLRTPDRLRDSVFRAYTRVVEPWLLARVDSIVAVSEDYRRAELGRWPHVQVVPHGVDTRLFHPRPRTASRRSLGLDEGAFVVLFVGNLDRAHQFKNVEGLIDAVGAVDGDALLVIAGDGDRRPLLTAYARRAGVASRVRFLGERAPAELAAVYSAADVTVLASTSTESFGLVLIESLACATPVVATSLPGVRTLVRPGVDGLLVGAGDARQLAEALEAMRRLGAERRSRWGVAGLERVRREFDWERVADQLDALYKRCRASRRRDRGLPAGSGRPAGMLNRS